MKRFGYLLSVLALLCLLLVALPFSASGTRFLLNVVERSGALQADYASGSLFGQLQLAQLNVDTGQVVLSATQLRSSLDISCFWTSRFCFDVLQAQSLRLTVGSPGNRGDGVSSEVPVTMLALPFAVEAPKLQLDQVSIQWPGGHWQQGALRADVSMSGSRLLVARARVDDARLEFAASPATDEGYPGFAPFDLSLPLYLDVSDLAINALQVQSGDEALPRAALALAGQWHGDELQLNQLVAAAEEVGTLTVAGAVTFNNQWPVQLQADLRLTADDAASLTQDRRIEIQLEGSVQALQVAAGSPGLPDVSVQARADLTAQGLPFSANAELDWPQGTRLGEILDAPGELADVQLLSPLNARATGSLAEQELNLSAQLAGLGYESLALTGSATAVGPAVTLNNLELFDAATDSRLSVTGTLNLDPQWALQLSARSDGLYVPPILSTRDGRISGSIDALLSPQAEGWRLQIPAVDITGEVNGLPADIQGSVGLTSSLKLLAGSLQAQVNGASLSFDAQADAGETALLALELDNLGRWVSGASGTLVLNGQVTPSQKNLSLDGRVVDLSLPAGQIPAASLKLSYAGESGTIDLSVRAPVMQHQDYLLRAVRLTLRGDATDHRFQLSSAGRLDGQVRVDGRFVDGQWQGVLAPTTLATSAGDWTLAAPVPLAWDKAQRAVEVTAHCWRHPEFKLCNRQLLIGRTGIASLDLQGDVRAFNGLLPRGLRIGGALSSEFELAWSEQGVSALAGAARVRDLKVQRRFGMGERVSVTWDSADLSVLQQGQTLALKGNVVREGRQVLRADVQLPATKGDPLSGRVILDALQLSTLAPWVTELSTLEGGLSGTLSLAGTPSDPQASGSLTLAGGKLVALGNPTELTDLNLRLQLDGTKGRLQGSGLLGGGELSLQGDLYAQPQLRLELAVSGQRHEILLPPSSELQVSEDLTLVLTGNLLDVRGDIRVHEGVLRHQELPAGSVGISQDVVEVDVQGNVIGETSPFDVRADLQLNVRDRFRVEGEEVNATLGGDLRLRQEPGKALQIFGNLTLQGGELYVYQQHLQVQRGTIAFSGPADNPELDIAAERQIRDEGVTVGARLNGPLEEPRLEVYSDPLMSQGEAMSYLVRGRGLDAGAGADGTALALSLGADIVNRSGVVTELNRLPLISNVAFGATGDEDDTAATVSGYIGNRIYLSYGIGIYEPINVLTARLYLQSRLWLEVMSRLENSVDLYYSFDIR